MSNRDMKGKFSKTGLILVGSMLICLILFLAVGVPNGFLGGGGQSGDLDDEDTPGIEEIMEGETPLFIFDKSEVGRTLVDAFDNGEIISVNLLYDDKGGSRDFVSEDADVIRQVYKALKNITVGEKTETQVTDYNHHAYFTLENGAEIGYDFYDENTMIYHDGTSRGTSYKIAGSEGLWKLYDELSKGE